MSSGMRLGLHMGILGMSGAVRGLILVRDEILKGGCLVECILRIFFLCVHKEGPVEYDDAEVSRLGSMETGYLGP